MRTPWLLPVVVLALLASPLAAVLCAAGACAVVERAESHCAMARDGGGTAIAAARADCCSDVAPLDPATAVQGLQVASWSIGAAASVTTAPPPAVTAHEPEAVAARGPNELLHRLGALLL